MNAKTLLLILISSFSGCGYICAGYAFHDKNYEQHNGSIPSQFEYKVIKRGIGRTFAKQVTAENTVYEIRRTFDLKGEIVTIPSNCTLKFEGGKIKNGTLIFSGTKIAGKKTKGIFKTINVNGTITGDCYAEWFSDGDILGKLFTIADRRVYLKSGSRYSINNKLVFPNSDFELIGNGATIKVTQDGARLSINSKDSITIRDIVFDGMNRTNLGVAMYRCNHVTISGVTIRNISWDSNQDKTYCYGIEMSACRNVLIDNSLIEEIKATPNSHVAGGVAVNVSGQKETSKNITIRNCTMRRIWSLNNGVGIGADCVVLAGRYEKDKDINAIIRNCTFSDFTKRAIKAQAGSVTITDCTFTFTDFMDNKEDPKYVVEVFGDNSYVTNNKILLQSKACHIGIGIYAGGDFSLSKGKVVINDKGITRDVVIRDNHIEADRMTYGILVGVANKEETNQYKNITIVNNVIKGRESLSYGIRTLDCLTDSRVEGNTIENANIGIWLNSPQKTLTIGGRAVTYYPQHSGVTIKSNIILGDAQQCGIQFDHVDNSTVTDNMIRGFKNGVLLGAKNTGTSIKKCTIDGNAISGCKWGIEASDRCTAVSITNNEFKENTYYDMVLSSEKKNFDLKGNITPKSVFYNNKR